MFVSQIARFWNSSLACLIAIEEEDAVSLDISHNTASSGNNEMHHCYNFTQPSKQVHPCNAKSILFYNTPIACSINIRYGEIIDPAG